MKGGRLVEERVPSLCNRVDTKKSVPFWAFITIVLFFLGIFILLFLRSPFSTIEKIEVTGNQLISTQNILERLPFSKSISFFSIDKRRTEKSISSLPEVKKVDVTRAFPNKVYITVTEKKVIGLIRSKYQLYPVFEDGLVIKKNYFNLETHDKPILEGWTFPNKTIQLASLNLSKLPGYIAREIDRIRPVEGEPDEVQILTKKHHQIFVRAAEIHKKMKVYSSFYDHPPGKLYLLESVWFKPEKYSS